MDGLALEVGLGDLVGRQVGLVEQLMGPGAVARLGKPLGNVGQGVGPAVGLLDNERFFWPFEAPAAFQGSEEATLAKFREGRDRIEARIVAWLDAQRASWRLAQR